MKNFLENHTESEVCFFHAQQQVFIKSIRQEKEEEQETIQQPNQPPQDPSSQI